MHARKNHIITIGAVSLALLALRPAAAVEPAQPYAGEQKRAIKALSENEIHDYRTGQGMGLSMAAELNHYPGPRHLIEMKDKIMLDLKQHDRIEMIFQTMRKNAVALGERIIDLETRLDRQFATGGAEIETVRPLIEKIGRAKAELRLVHLEAHMQTKALLSAEQIARYDLLRGYADGASSQHAPHGHGHTH
ncbi:MAG: hypothetical protein OQK07_02380 [Rhodospirillales bacterium]|nr:hypothetical protein [Rhodospirillales bacterium]